MTNTLTLEMDYLNARHGWMKCWLVINGEYYPMDASNVFPPFINILELAKSIVTNALPYEFYWEEEGPWFKFHASGLEAEDKFHLEVLHNNQPLFSGELDRVQVVVGLLDVLRNFSLDCPDAECEWRLPYFLIEDFEQSLASGFNQKVVTVGPDRARFIFSHYEPSMSARYPSFSIWVDEGSGLYLPMYDIPRLWHGWFVWLDQITDNQFPAQWTHFKSAAELQDKQMDLFIQVLNYTHELFAQAVPSPDHFYLTVTTTLGDLDPPHRNIEAIFERRQFVDAFWDAFYSFLDTNYRLYQAANPQRFDLKALKKQRGSE
jgi:hypothetical protein